MLAQKSPDNTRINWAVEWLSIDSTCRKQKQDVLGRLSSNQTGL